MNSDARPAALAGSRSGRRRLVVGGLAGATVVVAPLAVAAWLATGTGAATASATSVNAVAQAPTVTGQGAAARITWNASTLANGSSVDGYRVLRHVGSTVTTACTTSAPLAVTCDDTSPSPSTARYGVVAYKGAWSAPESPLSADYASDSTAPSTTITRDPASNDTTWSKANVVVTLAATDAGSGVKEIRYTINGGTEQVVSGASTQLTVTREDANALVFWAIDNLGNTETPRHSATVRVDKTAPLTTATLSSANAPAGGYYRSDVTVTLVAADTSPISGAAASGVSTVEYQLNGTTGTWSTYDPANKPVVSSEGTTTVHFRSSDLAGNTETAKQVTVQIDRTVPLVSSSLDPAPNPAGWNTGNVTVTLSASDAGSGVASTQYQLNGTGGTWLTYNPASKPLINADGTTTVYFRATDTAGNVSTPGTHVVKLDKTAPTVPTATVSPTSPNGLNGWYTTRPTVTLSGGTDTGGSGVERLEYQFNGTSGTWSTYTSSLVLPDQAITTVHFRSVDVAGNLSNTGAVTLKVDTAAPAVGSPNPATSTPFPASGSGRFVSTACNGTGQLCVDITDTASGVASATYKLTRVSGGTPTCWNGTTFSSGPCTAQPMSLKSGSQWGSAAFTGQQMATVGDYTWVVTPTDAAGNSAASNSYTFKVQ